MLNRYARIIVVVVVCCCLFAGSTQALVLGAVPINQGEGQALSVSDASSATAFVMSPLFAGGRNSAARIFSASFFSRLGPRKTMIRCIGEPPSTAFRVHCEDFEAGNYHSHNRYPEFFPCQVDDDDTIEPLCGEGTGDELYVF